MDKGLTVIKDVSRKKDEKKKGMMSNLTGTAIPMHGKLNLNDMIFA